MKTYANTLPFSAVASAVVVPEAVDIPRTGSDGSASQSTSNKRRQSSVSSQDSKRPRLSSEHSDSTIKASDDQPPPSSTAQPTESQHQSRRSPPTISDRRRSGQIEERKRGQRLFGALLGTLSQSAGGTKAQQRRLDIERKQQAKLVAQREEIAEKRKLDLEKLKEERRAAQKKFDEQSVRDLALLSLISISIVC
jgi:hypothetical protein